MNRQSNTVSSGRGTESPLVSIALAVFNGASTLELAIKSVLEQTYEKWELIILDDASTDNSLEVINSFDDARIKVIAGDENLGLSARLNMAMDMAKGKYMARMDQDDVCMPFRLDKQVEYLENHESIDMLGSSVIVFRGDGEVIGKLPVDTVHNEICRKPWRGFQLPHPTWMGRVEWFRRYRYVSTSDGAEDQNLLFRSHADSTFACLETPMLGYREEQRTMKKMFRSRIVFAKSMGRISLEDRRPFMAIGIVILQCMKIFGDILNIVGGVRSMRNNLSELSGEELTQWNTFWASLNSDMH